LWESFFCCILQSQLKPYIMTTAQEFLNQLYKDVQDDYTDSIDREDTLVLIDELILSLKNLK
jgi:hypothetical protein